MATKNVIFDIENIITWYHDFLFHNVMYSIDFHYVKLNSKNNFVYTFLINLGGLTICSLTFSEIKHYLCAAIPLKRFNFKELSYQVNTHKIRNKTSCRFIARLYHTTFLQFIDSDYPFAIVFFFFLPIKIENLIPHSNDES